MSDQLEKNGRAGPDQYALQTSSMGFHEHLQRPHILGEMHARPFLPLKLPRRIYHFAFMTDSAQPDDDRAAVMALAEQRGAAPPAADARFHHFDFGPWDLRWEQHAEFTTYTWSTSQDADEPFARPNPIGGEISFRGPGELIAAVHLCCISRSGLIRNLGEIFHPQSLCVIEAAEKSARVSTDFQVDPVGLTRILIESTGLTETRAGRLSQRVLEIETYRTLALLGLPMARSIRSDLDRMEAELTGITGEIALVEDNQESQALLRRLGSIAAELEAQAARTTYRFSATRAYYSIVESRLEVIREQKSGHFPRLIKWRLE